MPKVKAWKEGAAGQPSFASDFEILKKAVLQVTDIKTNRNKYYAIELHQAKGASDYPFRVYTHYGRTDDLDTNPNAGTRESRYHGSQGDAEANYDSIFKQKTSKRKGYKEVNLASSKIGSHKARGTSSGHVDAKTIEKMESKDKKGTKKKAAKPKPKKSSLPGPIQDVVKYLYDEAVGALTTTVNAKVTANGIETPLGVLTIGQVEKGEKYLDEAWDLFQEMEGSSSAKKARIHDKLTDLSGEFYSAIPHRIGRSRSAVKDAVIDTLAEFETKQETLQLMKDMLQVDGGDETSQSVLFDPEIDKKYAALKCTIDFVDPKSGEFKEWKDYVEKSQIKTKHIKVKNVYRIARPTERASFDGKIGNEKMLFHGSRIKNWVGILSRGILLPKIVVSMGVNRTDAGWLGNGIYFGDAACTSLYYTSIGRKKTRFMTIARVGMGKMKEYRKITYGLNSPPKGFDSCWGVRQKKGVSSQFADDEYVIYRTEQQQMEYLIEFSG
ncbi:MAG: WGR domain-containing protein [Myxococcota bacterium]